MHYKCVVSGYEIREDDHAIKVKESVAFSGGNPYNRNDRFNRSINRPLRTKITKEEFEVYKVLYG